VTILSEAGLHKIEHMTRRQTHFGKLADIPSGDDQAPTIGACPSGINHGLKLVIRFPSVTGPSPPLMPVYRPQLAIRIGPFILDGNLILVKATNIRLSP
jgi:hypothetical protein